MTANEIQTLLSAVSKGIPGANTQLVETHISWVILTENFAYKIKKPVKYSFLDFSTLKKRHYYCEREVLLNQRLAGQIYLGVAPIRKSGGHLTIGSKEGQIIDYAVKMIRLNASRHMNHLLKQGQVTPRHMDQIAEILASFHVYTDISEKPVNLSRLIMDYADILSSDKGNSISHFIKTHYGSDVLTEIAESIDFAKRFLHSHIGRMEERRQLGFVVDGHGDLHSGNIFLEEKPVIFDCIEFNDGFRTVDVLDELAFFCMDLELYDRLDLAQRFLQAYEILYPCFLTESDRLLYLYFKLYRSNVKIKVNVLKAMQAATVDIFDHRSALIGNYYTLFHRYYEELQILDTPS